MRTPLPLPALSLLTSKAFGVVVALLRRHARTAYLSKAERSKAM